MEDSSTHQPDQPPQSQFELCTRRADLRLVIMPSIKIEDAEPRPIESPSPASQSPSLGHPFGTPHDSGKDAQLSPSVLMGRLPPLSPSTGRGTEATACTTSCKSTSGHGADKLLLRSASWSSKTPSEGFGSHPSMTSRSPSLKPLPVGDRAPSPKPPLKATRIFAEAKGATGSTIPAEAALQGPPHKALLEEAQQAAKTKASAALQEGSSNTSSSLSSSYSPPDGTHAQPPKQRPEGVPPEKQHGSKGASAPTLATSNPSQAPVERRAGNVVRDLMRRTIQSLIVASRVTKVTMAYGSVSRMSTPYVSKHWANVIGETLFKSHDGSYLFILY